MVKQRSDLFTSPAKKAFWVIFAPKIPKISAGFEPANLITIGQHATFGITKALFSYYQYIVRFYKPNVSPRLKCRNKINLSWECLKIYFYYIARFIIHVVFFLFFVLHVRFEPYSNLINSPPYILGFSHLNIFVNSNKLQILYSVLQYMYYEFCIANFFLVSLQPCSYCSSHH